MKRWELVTLISLVVGFLVVLALWRSPGWRQPTPPEPEPAVSVNPTALITADGSPLPTVTTEDLVVEVHTSEPNKALEEQTVALHIDAQTKNWEMRYFAEGATQKLRYVNGLFLLWDPLKRVWDQTPEPQPGETLYQVNQIGQSMFLSPEDLVEFNASASLEEDEPCGDQRQDICAVWEAHDLWRNDVVVIQVSRLTRQIASISFLSEDGSFVTAFYDHGEAVDITLPSDVRLGLS